MGIKSFELTVVAAKAAVLKHTIILVIAIIKVVSVSSVIYSVLLLLSCMLHFIFICNTLCIFFPALTLILVLSVCMWCNLPSYQGIWIVLLCTSISFRFCLCINTLKALRIRVSGCEIVDILPL